MKRSEVSTRRPYARRRTESIAVVLNFLSA
jgi:hypothetical protein